MNILCVSDVSVQQVLGGAERVLFEQGTRLALKGHAVHLITRRLPAHRSARETVQGIDEIRYAFEPDRPLRSTVWTWNQPRRHLISLLKQGPIDVLNIHQPFTACGLISQAAALGIPRVYTCHSLSAEEYLSRNAAAGPAERMRRRIHAALRNGIEGIVIRCCNRIIALSRYTQEKLQRIHGIPGGRVAIVPGGVDLVRFHPISDKSEARRELSIPEDRFVLLTIRNLVPRMGLSRLVCAVQKVAAAIPQVFLVIGGQGPLRAELEAMIHQRGLHQHVRLAGYIPEDTLPRYYQMSDLFVLPSLDLEGFGMVTLEALASGLPVLGTPVGGTREVLSQWDASFLMPDNRQESLVQGILNHYRRFTEGTEPSAGMSSHCREFVEEKYSWDRNVSSLESILIDAGKTLAAQRPATGQAEVRN